MLNKIVTAFAHVKRFIKNWTELPLTNIGDYTIIKMQQDATDDILVKHLVECIYPSKAQHRSELNHVIFIMQTFILIVDAPYRQPMFPLSRLLSRCTTRA